MSTARDKSEITDYVAELESRIDKMRIALEQIAQHGDEVSHYCEMGSFTAQIAREALK